MSFFRILAILLVPACSHVGPVTAARPDAAQAAAPADTFTRTALRAVPVPLSVRGAVERGTRTKTGEPGPRYWQQSVSYRIEAEVDPDSTLLRGREWIVYRNRSPDTLRSVVLNLYQNLFSEGVPRNRRVQVTGGVVLEEVSAQGRKLEPVPAERIGGVRNEPEPGSALGFAVDGTLARLVLPEPIVPGDSAVLQVAWRHRIPPAPGFRAVWEDALGGRVLQVAQWYPQVAVYDDVRGWDATPYLGDGEFYLEFGDFDVSITLPSGWLVGATGTLQNPDEVLAPRTRDRLREAATSDTTVRIVDEGEREAGSSTRAGRGGKLTWRFRADRVRDFAFSTSNRYVWDAVRATIPAEGGGTDPILVHSLYRPGAPGWDQAARYGKHAMEFFGGILPPYPYPQVTVAEGGISGGIEYPHVVFIGRPERAEILQATVAHELAHQWFPMMVGSDEGAYAWMDEGVATYYDVLARDDFYPGGNALHMESNLYRSVAGTDAEAPMMRHLDLFSPYADRRVAAYSKPAVVLRSLREVVGDEVFREAMDAYTREWLFKHPTPWDLFNTFERVAGRNLDWFFYPWWWETGTIEFALDGVRQVAPGAVQVTVRDLGRNPGPTLLAVTTADGAVHRVRIPVERWIGERRRSITLTVPVGAPVTKVEIDPEHLFPEVYRRNNTWQAPAEPR